MTKDISLRVSVIRLTGSHSGCPFYVLHSLATLVAGSNERSARMLRGSALAKRVHG